MVLTCYCILRAVVVASPLVWSSSATRSSCSDEQKQLDCRSLEKNPCVVPNRFNRNEIVLYVHTVVGGRLLFHRLFSRWSGY